MNDKKQLWKNYENILLKKLIGLMFFVVLSFSFFSLPVIAEQTADEASEIEAGGVIFRDNHTEVYKNPEGIAAFSNLPDSINLSTSNYFPPIRNQGQNNSCVAWSQVYYQFTYQAARLNNWDAKHDDSKVFSPKYVWNYLNGGKNEGLPMNVCCNILEEQGALRWNEFPQTDLSFEWYMGENEEKTVAALRNALKVRVSEFHGNEFAKPEEGATPVTGNKDSDLMHMKQLLNTGHVLSISTQCKVNKTSNNKVLSNGERGIVAGEINLDEKGGIIGHALTIVGYDDNIYYDLNGNGNIESFEQGAFLAANSWGTNAEDHNNGYIWILYDALNDKSNVSSFNNTSRRPFIYNNEYWYMEVENYNPKRMVEVTLEQKYRNDISVYLGISDSLNSWKTRIGTFLSNLGGAKSFDGGNNGYQTCTFVFDYDTLYNGDDKVYWVEVTDNVAGNGASTTVKKIRWVDGNGKVLKTLGQQPSLDGETEPYFYGIPVQSITLNKTSSTLHIGETEQLTATVFPDNATENKVKWTSSNSSVVRVDSSGKVTYVGIGTAIVTATATDGSGVSASCTYRITDDYYDTYDKAFIIAMHTKTSGAINISGDVDYFKFTPTATGVYLIYTIGDADTMGYLYDASQNLLVQNNDASLSGNNFALKYTLTAGKTYYIKVGGNGTKTGSYTLNVSKDFYGASLASNNQDARRVQMQAEAATALTTLKLTIGGKTYTLNRPASGNLETTIGEARFKVTFEENNNGLSTIWKIEASIPVTTSGGDTVSFDFSKGSITNVKSADINGLVAYGSAIQTGVETSAADSLKRLLTTMQQAGYTLTVRSQKDTLINVTSTTRAATGMKIIETNSNGLITKVYYLVVFGDVTGDAYITTDDALVVLQAAIDVSNLGALAKMAADVNHDGNITTDDGLLINQYTAGMGKIDQNYAITTVPDDCYYLDPIIF